MQIWINIYNVFLHVLFFWISHFGEKRRHYQRKTIRTAKGASGFYRWAYINSLLLLAGNHIDPYRIAIGPFRIAIRMHSYASVWIRMHSYASIMQPYAPIRIRAPSKRITRATCKGFNMNWQQKSTDQSPFAPVCRGPIRIQSRIANRPNTYHNK